MLWPLHFPDTVLRKGRTCIVPLGCSGLHPQGLSEQLRVLVHVLFESWDVRVSPLPCINIIWILFSKEYFKLKREKVRNKCYWAGNVVMQNFHLLVSWLSGRHIRNSCCWFSHQNATMEICLDVGRVEKLLARSPFMEQGWESWT